MKRKVITVFSALAFCLGTAYSQSMMDAYRYVQSELSGTARAVSMGGAFGALGGDVSVMNINPAGLAIYRSSEVVTTLSLNMINTKSDWIGTSSSENKTKVNFDNIAYVGYFPTANEEGLVSWNVGFSYNRLKNYSRDYTARTSGLDYSMSDYAAVRANLNAWTGDQLWQTNDYNPYENPEVGDWMSIIAMNSGMIEYDKDKKSFYSPFATKDASGGVVPTKITEAIMNIRESGSVDQYNIAFGANISNFLMLGAGVAITDLNYNYLSYYNEKFADNSTLTLGTDKGGNGLNTDGTGYSFNIGAIVNPVNFLRLGVAYTSPTWYKMTDFYYTEASTTIGNSVWTANTPAGAYSKYEYRSPDKWTFSAAAILGQVALVSVDYELMNYKRMRMYDYYGNQNTYTNGDIQNFMKNSNTLRVGAEVKVTPQFAVRAGASWTQTGMNNDLKNNNVSVATAGTMPHYNVDLGITNYTVGIGYRFTPRFYADLACVLRSQKEDLYAFSPIFDEEGQAVVDIQPASLKTKTTRLLLTLGYKF